MTTQRERPTVAPRHFFLNEAHELPTLTTDGGGGWSKFAEVDWVHKSISLRDSLDRVAAYSSRVRDPSVRAHQFLLTIPASLTKLSESRKAKMTGGRVAFTPRFGGSQANVLEKLGFDLVSTDDSGNATVHVHASKLTRIRTVVSGLATAKRRDKERWIQIGDFREIGWTSRIDATWLDSLDEDMLVDTHIRFHALLSKSELLSVLEAIWPLLGARELLRRRGVDFSGRHWIIAQLRKTTLRVLAEQFPSIQSIHPRLSTSVAVMSRHNPTRVTSSVTRPINTSQLPIIGMLDTGVPESHPILTREYIPYRYTDPHLVDELAPIGDHGSQVASALVFGHIRCDGSVRPQDFPPASCRVFDMVGGWSAKHAEVPDEISDRAIDAVLATVRDVRVFNLSLGGPKLNEMNQKEREEKLRYLECLDNQAFARDILLVCSAGNSNPGVAPADCYPGHVDDKAWSLRVMALNYNGLVVGAHVDPIASRGIAVNVGAPSPFTLIGPGLNHAPVPNFSAPGGDVQQDYTPARGCGIWCFNSDGMVEDCIGTSYSAPLVAREAAFAFQELAQYCPDQRPFAATVRAWLTMVAHRPKFQGALEVLAKRTIGCGFPSARSLQIPERERAIFVWQALLESAGSTARVAIPVPNEWRQMAKMPLLRLVVSWLTPVNAALCDLWACRKVTAQLRTSHDPKANPLRFRGRATYSTYPLIDRTYEIGTDKLESQHIENAEDLWTLSITYEDIGPTPLGMAFAPQQRVGVVIELRDDVQEPTSPQPAIVSLNVPPMTHLSNIPVPLPVPVVVKL